MINSADDTAQSRHAKIVREPMPYGKVLVVDDMKSNLDVAVLLMTPYQLQIDTAESGCQALDFIKSGNKYDIIFMDHMMPEMDGIQTIKKMRGAGYKDPVFMITADAGEDQRKMYKTYGFDGFISKPIDIHRLNDALNEFVRDKKRGRSHSQKASVPDRRPADFSKIRIPGVDAETGLGLYGYDMDVYLSVLRSYLPNAKTVIENLRTVSEKTLPLYTVGVHGLKGISAGIGAKALSDSAYALELKARAGDLAGVLAGNDALLEDTQSLVTSVEAWLEEHDKNVSKPRFDRPDRAVLLRLRKSCEAFDMNDADNAMDILESADYENDESLIIWLREKIDESDFSAAVCRLLEYEEESR